MEIGDKVLIKAEIVGITEADNPIIKTEGGIKMLVKKSDVAEDNTMEWKAIYDRTEVGGITIARLSCFECSGCNKQADHMYNFCPHCGRKAVFE